MGGVATPLIIRHVETVNGRSSWLWGGRSTMNISKPRLLIFIVAYFAEHTIEKVVRRIPADLSDTYDVEILIIDDSSKDTTFAEGVKIGRDADIPFNVTPPCGVPLSRA